MAWAGPGLRGLAYVLVPIALVLAHRNVGLATALIGLTALPAAARLRLPRWTWPLLGVVVWLSLTSLWTPSVDDLSWAWRLPLAVLVAVACVLASGQARVWERKVFTGAILLGIALLGVEAISDGAIRDVMPPAERSHRDDVSSARGIGAAILLLPPALLLLRQGGASVRRTLLVGSVGLLLLGLGVWRFGVIANGLALAAILAFGALALAAPRRTVTGLLLAAAASTLLVPLGALALPPPDVIEAMGEGPLSWRQRLLAWRLVADAAQANVPTLLFGAGQNAAGPLGDAAGTVRFPGTTGAIPRLPSHPHNVVLHLWYEGGLVALGLAATGLAAAAHAAARRAWPRDFAAGAAALGGAWLVAALIEVDLWSGWRWACLALAVFGLRLAGAQDVVNPSAARYRSAGSNRVRVPEG